MDDPIYAPHIAYGHSAKADYFVMAYRRPNGQIVARTVSSGGGLGSIVPIASSSNGPPVVAYSYADDRWAVFWRSTVSNLLGTSATIQGHILRGGKSWLDPLGLQGARISAVSVPLGEFITAPTLLPDYSAAGTQTATEFSPFRSLFELAYVQSGEVYSVRSTRAARSAPGPA